MIFLEYKVKSRTNTFPRLTLVLFFFSLIMFRSLAGSWYAIVSVI